MVGASGTIGSTAQGKDDDADRSARRAKDSVVGGRDAIGVVEQILSVLQGLIAERRDRRIRSLVRSDSVPTNCDVALIAGPCGALAHRVDV